MASEQDPRGDHRPRFRGRVHPDLSELPRRRDVRDLPAVEEGPGRVRRPLEDRQAVHRLRAGTSPPTSAPSWRAPSALVRNVRPMQNRSGRSHSVSPPSIVPGGRESGPLSGSRPRASMFRGRRVRDALIGLARPKRDRAPIGHEQRIERVDEVGRIELGRRGRGRAGRARPVSRRTHRARAGRRRGRPGGRKPCAGSSNARPKAAPGRLTRTSSSGADMLWAPYRRSVVSMGGQDSRGRRSPATRRPRTVMTRWSPRRLTGRSPASATGAASTSAGA